MSAPEILIVEDDEKLLELLTWLMSRQGFAIRATDDGEEALRLAQRSTPDVVLLDWMMPGRSGLDVCRALTAGGFPGAVAIHTGLDDPRDRSAARAAGATAFLVKGMANDELERAVRALVPPTAAQRFAERTGLNVKAV